MARCPIEASGSSRCALRVTRNALALVDRFSSRSHLLVLDGDQLRAAIARVHVDGHFVRVFEQMNDNVATIASQFPFWCSGWVQHEDTHVAFQTAAQSVWIHTVRTCRMRARVATARALFHVPAIHWEIGQDRFASID
jgi:hypothetical protein